MSSTYTPEEHNQSLNDRAERMRLAKHKMLLSMNGVRSFWATASSEAYILVHKIAIERFLPYFLHSMVFRNVLVPDT